MSWLQAYWFNKMIHSGDRLLELVGRSDLDYQGTVPILLPRTQEAVQRC
jgi:hypothetical protein